MSVALNCSKKNIVPISDDPHFGDYEQFMPSLDDAERFAMERPAEPKPLSVAGILVASILSGGLWLLAYWGFKAVMRAFGVNMDGAL